MPRTKPSIAVSQLGWRALSWRFRMKFAPQNILLTDTSDWTITSRDQTLCKALGRATASGGKACAAGLVSATSVQVCLAKFPNSLVNRGNVAGRLGCGVNHFDRGPKRAGDSCSPCVGLPQDSLRPRKR